MKEQEQEYLRNEIAQALEREPRIGARIDVEVQGRIVRISGIVRTLEQKEIAEQIAQRFGPVQLDSDIIIESPMIIDDGDVLAEARKAIAKDTDLAHDIGVGRVVDGIVYLQGHSESVFEIERAADIVASAPGVKDIVSEVRIKTDVLITDVDLVDEVMQRLRVEPTIEAESLTASAKNGTVKIEGTVKNIKQKMLASNLAKQMPGVVKIENDLAVSEHPVSLDVATENEVLRALEMSRINMTNMRVNVLDGVVYLDGTVDTYGQKELAQKIAGKIPEVRFVQNDLVIGFHVEKSA
ncbi:MAG: BON domain-containing protein [Candidatus Aquicultor sp.]